MRRFFMGWMSWALVLCGLLWLTGQVVFQLSVASAPRFAELNIANLLQMVATGLAFWLLINSNTRRDSPPDLPNPIQRPLDPFSLPTEDLVGIHVGLPDGRQWHYGRREGDNLEGLAGELEDLLPAHVGSSLARRVKEDEEDDS